MFASFRRSLLLAASVVATTLGAQSSDPTVAAAPVGFRVVRSTQPPLSLAMWYPATRANQAATMTIDDYLNAEIPADRLQYARANFLTGIARSYGGARGLPSGPTVPELPDSVARALMTFRTKAVKDAPPVGGRHPAVIFTIPLGSTGAANVNLIAEEIASRGYVVASGPPVSAPDGASLADYLRLIRAGAEQIYDAVVQLPGVDGARIVALDPTGSTALMMEAERKRWRAVIAFDERPFEPEERSVLVAAAGSMSTSLLYFPLGDAPPNGDVIRQLTRVDRTDAVIPGARHGLLESYGPHFKRRLGEPSPEYDEAMRRMLEFLERVRSR